MNNMLDQGSLWAINVVIHTTVLTVASLLLAHSFRKLAAMRYWILCCGMLLVLCSPVIAALMQSRGESWLVLSKEIAETTFEPIAASDHIREFPPGRDALATIPVTQTPQDLVQRHDMKHARLANQLLESSAALLASAASDSPIVPADPEAETSLSTQWLRLVVVPLTLVWAIGSIVCLVRMLVGWFRLSRLLQRAEPIDNAVFHRAFERACQTAGCHRDHVPRLLHSADVSGPIAASLFNSAVVIPTHWLDKVQPAEMADVLVHEIAHVVRHDQITVLVQNVVAAIYWPHPLVKRLNIELAKAREEICDNFVLGSTAAPAYSRTLLSLAEMVQRSDRMPGSVGFFTSGWKLEQRVAGILDEHRDRTTFLSKRGWAFVAASSFALITLTCLGTITLATAQNRGKGIANLIEDKVADKESIAVSGIVLGPDGSPVAGAHVIAVEQFVANTSWTRSNEILAETFTNSGGRYSLILSPPSSGFSNGKHLGQQSIGILATHADFGPGETLALGMIDIQADPKTWPKPKHESNSLIESTGIAEPTGVMPVESDESASDIDVKPMFGGRSGAVKAALLARDGSPETAKAVELGLEWLARQQRKDGSWSMRGTYEDGSYQENTTAATAMALLAFQGDGNTHRDGLYAKKVAQGLEYLLNRQSKENGFFADNEPDRQQAYAHAQATIAVCELYGMTQDPLLRQPAEAAVEFSVEAQSDSGGWRYLPRSGSDLSVTGWYVTSLVSAKSAGIRVKDSVLAEVQSYLDRVSVEDGAGYCYQEGRPASPTMTAEGLLCRQYLGWAHDHEPMAIGLNTLVQNWPISRDAMNVYYWYYATQALHHFGGSGWATWNNNMKQILPAMQVKRGNESGSWSPQTDKFGITSGRLYTTCFCIYCLEVYY